MASQARGGALALIALAPVLLIAACGDCTERTPGNTSKTGPISLGRVNWQEHSENESAPFISPREFQAMTETSLGAVTADSNVVKKVSVSGALKIVGDGASLVLAIKMHLAGHMKPFETGIEAVGSAGDEKQAESLVNQALSDLAHAVKNLSALAAGNEAALIAALDAAEPDEQLLALKILGHKKTASAVPAIGLLLEDPRIIVQESAAEALARIGDERAVPLLIAAIKRYDIRSEVRAIEAMGRIGGEEARAYLEMTATGHDIPEVRKMSAALLDNMNER